ncbi:MAG: hypothetical protein M3Q39_00470 [Actinomycetota bacterium]|nr:hypothetical protein [Actinomycetota bacterium]
MRSKVTVTYLDGTAETWDYVEVVRVFEGVLYLENRRPYYGGTDHLASIPLASIRKWERKKR